MKSEPVKEEADLKSEPGIKQEPEDSETDSDWDDAEFGGDQSVSESDMVKVCGDEGEDEDGAHNEMDELRKMSQKAPSDHQEDVSNDPPIKSATAPTKSAVSKQTVTRPAETHLDSETESEPDDAPTTTAPSKPTMQATTDTTTPTPTQPTNGTEPHPTTGDLTSTSQPGTCPICSLLNDPTSPTCMACSNVLQPSLMPDHWRCMSSACEGSAYINIGDAGRCGLCEGLKPKQSVGGGSRAGGSGGGTRAVGVIGGDVLRWD
jgi:hypothetical protein